MKPFKLKPASMRPFSVKPLAMRPFGYDENPYTYLIKNGFLTSAVNFERVGSAIYDGVEFPQNVPVRTPDKTRTWTNKCEVDGVPDASVLGITGSATTTIVHNAKLGHSVYRLENNTDNWVFQSIAGASGALVASLRIQARCSEDVSRLQLAYRVDGLHYQLFSAGDAFRSYEIIDEAASVTNNYMQIGIPPHSWVEFFSPELYPSPDLPPSPIISSADGPVSKTFVTEVVSPKALVTCGEAQNALHQSDDLTQAPWLSTLATREQATEGTHLACVGNQEISQAITVTAGETWVFEFEARNTGGSIAMLSIRDLTNSIDILYQDSFFDEIDSADFRLVSRVFTVPSGCTSVGVYPLRDSDGADIVVKGLMAYKRKYSIHPVSIPTTDDPLSMATMASSDIPGNLNGATVDLWAARNRGLLEVLDGRVVNENIVDRLPDYNTSGAVYDEATGEIRIVSDGTNEYLYWYGFTTGIRYELDYLEISKTGGGLKIGNPLTLLYAGSAKYRIVAAENRVVLGRASDATDTTCKLSAKKILPAAGALYLDGLEIIPELDQWETSGPLKILMGDAGNAMFQVNNADGKFELTDGTNTIAYDVPYVAGTKYTIILAWSAAGMYLIVNGVQSPTVPFVGTFNLGRYFKINGHEDIVKIPVLRTHKIAA